MNKEIQDILSDYDFEPESDIVQKELYEAIVKGGKEDKMTNDELKKKIVEILVNCKSDECAIDLCSECTGNPCISNCREKEQADALIAAGIGDVKETEHRAEVAERALEILNDYECLSNPIRYYMKQAEKELSEERKDD